MKTKIIGILMVGTLLITLICGCGSSNSSNTQSVGADIIQKYNFKTIGQPTTTAITLPQQFTDANWGLKQMTCQQAGYDLTPFAGQDITAVQYNIAETYFGASLTLIVLAKDPTSICGYVVDGSVPGIHPVNDPNIK